MHSKSNLTPRQQVWLAAYTASLQSFAKYNPKNEAFECLKEFDLIFGKGQRDMPQMIKDIVANIDNQNPPAPDDSMSSEIPS